MTVPREAKIIRIRHRDIAARWLPDNHAGSLAAAVLCFLHLHPPHCRGTTRCGRRRFGVMS